MYSRILVAVDGSANSEHALRHAVGLAKALSASLRIIHVVDMGLLPYGLEFGVDIHALIEARHAAAEKTLSAARDSARMQGIEVEARLVDMATPPQHVAGAIAEAAAGWPADLAVLGTHGRRGMERWMIGSVAEGVARRSTVPVLLIPMPAA
jgi:nucleotide-binding universal stress UspA family protein